jgi:hypothetical protein
MKNQMSVVIAALCLGLSASVCGTILYVPSQYATIQAGIGAAAEGDTVLVADGTYTGDGNCDLDFGGVNMVVMSENGPEKTTIDCEGTASEPHRGFYFHSGEDLSSVVQGFTITNGWVGWGAGFYCGVSSSPTIVGNIIAQNTSYGYYGSAGIFCSQSSPTIERNTITGNAATTGFVGGIGAIEFSSPMIVENTITGNMAGLDAGGIGCASSSPTIEGNTIVGNTAEVNSGGIGCGWGASPAIVGNMIAGNWTVHGFAGGIGVGYSSSPTIAGNTITGNAAGTQGGGMGFTGNCSPIIAGNTMTGNVAERGGGIWCDSLCSPMVINSILWGDSAGTALEIYLDNTFGVGSSITVSYSDVAGGSLGVYVAAGCTLNWGEGNIDEDPMFVLAEKSDYRLLWGSPCIDAGHPDSLDPDGTRCDMGAYFFDQDDYMTLYLTPDETEVSPGGVLGVTYTAINRWAQPETFWVLTEATLPNGNPRTVMGPDRYTLPANTTRQQHLTHNVPGVAPLGLYGYRSRIGVPPSTLYDEDSFAFWVVAP